MAQNVVHTHSRSRSFTALAAGGSMLTAGAGVGTLATALFIGLAGPAGATTLTVSNTLDSGAGSLRQAMINANAAAGADTINFASGVTGTITLASDLPDVTESLTITGPGSAALTISGAGVHHVFGLHAANSGSVTISGLTITNSIGTSGDWAGGAIDAINTAVNLDDVDANHNSVDSGGGRFAGGAILVRNASGTGNVTLTNSVISNNSSSGTGDVSAYAGGVGLIADEITITNSTVEQNNGAGVGGLLTGARVALTMTGTAILNNNSAVLVGGFASFSGGTTITDSVISGNTSGAIGGAYILGEYINVGCGGNYGTTQTPISITNTRISDNSGALAGGALIGTIYQGATATLDRLTVTGNAASRQNPQDARSVGGLATVGPTTLSNSTIADNAGIGITLSGAIIINTASVSTSVQSVCSVATPNAGLKTLSGPPPGFSNSLAISHSTISGNTRQGIAQNDLLSAGSTPTNVSPSAPAPTRSVPTVTLDHVLVANNGVEDIAVPATATFSLIQKPNASLITGIGTLTGIDPGLKPLELISDTVSVVPIAMGSAAWNAGNPNFTPPPATDQRGLPRVVDIIDIGAYEVQDPFVLPKFTG